MKLSALSFCLFFSMNLQAQQADEADSSENPVNNKIIMKEDHITLSWYPSVHLENETPLALKDIDGYFLYYKKISSKKDFLTANAEAIFVAENNKMSAKEKRSFRFEGLSNGNYCFAITTLALGLESSEPGEDEVFCVEVAKE